MGARKYSQVEIDELLELFPLEQGVPPFGTKLTRFCKRWNRSERAVRAFWHKISRGEIHPISVPNPENNNPSLTLGNLTESLKELRGYLSSAVDELDKLIGN